MRYWLALTALIMSGSMVRAEPVRMIFDTDMGNDIDDAMALAMIHQFTDRGAINLLAVTSSKDHPKSAPYIDALNTYYGYPDIPIGAVHGGATPEEGKYNHLAELNDEAGKPLYPHDLTTSEDAPEAVDLIRKTLASQPDGSVVLVQVGFFTNFARLLDSKPDAHSSLDGKALIQKKVKELVLMAGAFQPIKGSNRYGEYNIIKDLPAAKKIASEWPGRIVWSGYEVGINSAYPLESIEEDYDYREKHLIKESYLAFFSGKPKDRPTWDLSCVLYAVFPDRGYFDLSPSGVVTINENGRTNFTADSESGNNVYLRMNSIQAARVVEAYLQLCPEPPAAQ